MIRTVELILITNILSPDIQPLFLCAMFKRCPAQRKWTYPTN